MPDSRWSRGVHLLLILAAVAAVAYLPGLGRETGVTGQDEYLISLRTSIEMLESGHFLTPWREGGPKFEKPPLVYWTALVNHAVFGISLFGARIWGVVWAVALAWITGLTAERLRPGRSLGLVSGLLVLTCGGVAVQGRMQMLDLPLALFVTLSVYLFVRYRDGGRLVWLVGSAVAAGLGFLVKGPLGPGFAIMAIVVYSLVFRSQDRGGMRWWHALVALAALIAVVIPWPLAMFELWGERFTRIVDHELTTARFRGDRTGPEAILGGMLVLVLPWAFLYLVGLVTAFRRWFRERDRVALWLALWNLVLSVPFLLLRLKFERYLMVAVPAAILLVTVVPVGSARAERIARGAGMSLFVLVALTFSFFGVWFGVAPLWAVLALVAVCGAMLWIGWGAARPDVLVRLALAAALGNALLFGVVYPSIGVQRVPDELARLDAADRPLVYYRGYNPGLLSMNLKRSVRWVEDDDRLPEFGPILLIVEDGEKREKFVEFASESGAWPQEPVATVRTFYSRKAWLRFARESATSEDWKRAFETRDLDDLKATFEVYRWPPDDPVASEY